MLVYSMYAAFDKLSPYMKKTLSGLTAQNRRPVTTLKKEVVDRSQVNSHPLIRTHPVTGWQMVSLAMNSSPRAR